MKKQLLKLDQTFLIDARGADQLAVKRTTTAAVTRASSKVANVRGRLSQLPNA